MVGIGGEAVDYSQDWLDGKLAVREAGIWEFPTENSNTKRTFEFGMMPPPIKNSENTGTIEWVENSGPYNPSTSQNFNIIKCSLQDRPEYNLDYAVDFLKFTHTTVNMGIMVEESNGTCMGAIKNCPVPASLQSWYKQSFPKLPTANIPSGSTADGNLKLSKLLENYFLDQITEQELKKEWDKAMYEDLLLYVENNNIDTSEWGEIFVPDAAK